MLTLDKSILIISGWDSSGCAGMLVDIATAQTANLPSCGVITAITAQSNEQVFDIKEIKSKLFQSQLTTALKNQPVACKVGMLASVQQVEILAQELPNDLPIIIDPVITSSSGTRLMQNDVISAIQDQLFPKCLLLTPNLDELFQLTQTKPHELNIEAAIQSLFTKGCRNILLKGGHLDKEQLTDSLFQKQASNHSKKPLITNHFQHPRQPGNYRGTGCLLATAIACQVARQPRNLVDACQIAINYLQHQLANTPTNGNHAVKILQQTESTF